MIIGHKKQIRILNNILASKNIPQTYFFSGPKGVGKLFVAKLFANSLINEYEEIIDYNDKNNSLLNLSVLTLESNKNVIEKNKTTVGVGDVRKECNKLSLFPTRGKFRVLIIDDAEKLNISSQNTLLKTLEEPNETSIIILVASEEEGILKTILSRCQRIQFDLVSFEEMRYAFANSLSSEELDKAIVYSMGRPKNILKILEKKSDTEKRDFEIKELKKIIVSNNFEKFELAEKYSKNFSETSDLLEFWIWFLRIQAYRQMNDDNKKWERYYDLIEKIDQTLQKIKTTQNLNKKLILENLFLNL